MKRFYTVAMLGLIGACATGEAPTVPEPIRASSNDRFTQTIYARGVQIYKCQATKDDPSKGEWAFQSPEADLFSDAAMTRTLGKHYGGPTWESSDGSKVVGAVKASSPAPDGFSIPWLLLDAKSTSGAGAFSKVSSIQRVDTKGGRAPQGPCSKNQLDVTIRVNYTAAYHFYSK
jgi:hypothetical protein